MIQPALPKVELHCHLLGVIHPQLLEDIQRSGGTVLVEPCILEAAYPISNVASFRRWVEVLRPYQSATIDAMRPILAAHISDLIAQDVIYAEIMISPTMFPREKPALLDTFHTWREWTSEMERSRVQVEFIMVVPRTLDPDLLKRDTESFIELHREGLIAGVALVGPENGESIQRFETAFSSWREAGLGVEIHAGEHTGPESVWDALRYGSPHRLGHGLSAFQDPALLDELRRQGIHVEFCLTSNICTGAVEDIEQHPAGRAKELGMNFSLNTDNPGAFQCSLQSEFQLASKTLRFEPDDFQSVFRSAFAARFQAKLRHWATPADMGNGEPEDSL